MPMQLSIERRPVDAQGGQEVALTKLPIRSQLATNTHRSLHILTWTLVGAFPTCCKRLAISSSVEERIRGDGAVCPGSRAGQRRM
jgi:hypothetical protein